ncbi:ABC transporter permease subunit, partial [Fusobacterium mortiferum]
MSFSLKVPVFTKLISSFLITLKLSVVSFVLMLLISIPLGFISALNRNKIIDYIIRGFSFLGISIPSFWMGLI